MNAIFMTQSSNVHMFYGLMEALREPLQLGRVGFYLSDSWFFRMFREHTPDIESGAYVLLKEWDITTKGERAKADISLLRHYEEVLGMPDLWGAIIADRRIIYGQKFALRQDYRPRLNHDEILAILQEGLIAIERFFDIVQPDFVASFQCTTFGEYLAYLLARQRGVPFLNLRPTRVANYVIYGESIFEPSRRVQEQYERYLTQGIQDQWTKRAQDYLLHARQEDARYEGVISPSRKPPKTGRIARMAPRWDLLRLLRQEYHYRFRSPRCDANAPGVLVPYLYRVLLNPLRAHWINARFGKRYLSETDLDSLDYAFFPLHTEPEVTLMIYSRPYLNQIEVVRNIAYNLPVGMKLVVKEHPWSVGKRPVSYYQKLLAIPNVCLADPALPARPLIAHSHIVATIAGSVGFEAVLLGKPVVTFGGTPYEILPSTIVRRVRDLNRLGIEIADLLCQSEYQEHAVISYVAAIMSQSVPINLYSTLMRREGTHVSEHHSDAEQDIKALAQYTVATLAGIQRSMKCSLPGTDR